MKVKIAVLTVAAFTVGLIELIIGGILPRIAEDLGVSIGQAGQLITIYALVYAIAGPLLLSWTGQVERKRLYIIAMTVFAIGSLLAWWSPDYTVLFISRIVTAISGSLIITLSLTIAARIAAQAYRARVLGIISAGISSSLVLGLPLGVLIGEKFGWRILFLIIALLTIGAIILIMLYLEQIPSTTSIPLGQQLRSLASSKIISAHLIIMLTLAGHYTLYAYFTPFLQTYLHAGNLAVSGYYLLFGVAAVSGGLIGGGLADKIGAAHSMVVVVVLFIVVLLGLPSATVSAFVFMPVVALWGVLSWALSPAQMSYLIEHAPDSADFQQSFSYSSLQIGIALGSATGGIVVEQSSSLSGNAYVGACLIAVALLSTIFSLTRKRPTAH